MLCAASLACVLLSQSSGPLSGALAGARTSIPTGEPHTRFAVIGDYGVGTAEEATVSALVHGWNPDFVVTLGDNNYPAGEASTIDANIGQYFHEYIGHYSGSYGPSLGLSRFFPTLGNHDWSSTPPGQPYFDYFTLPGNERYYDVRQGAVQLFALDSDPHEPDGIDSASVQAQWLQSKLASSNAPFKFVYFHHPAFSSGQHGSTAALQWPFQAWGASAVLQGHDHMYERILRAGFPYLTCGIGGNALYSFSPPVAGSEARFAADHGALLVDATPSSASLRCVSASGIVMDECVLFPNAVPLATSTLVAAGSSWKYKDDGSNQGTAWRASGFDDSSWASGPAQLGYGDGDEATVVNGGPAGAHFITTWFRKSFVVADPALYHTLELQLVRDDGALVWLNGSELARSNLGPDPIDWLSPASSVIGGADESAFHSFVVSPALLVAGTNTLAVEIHQSSAASSDISFNLKLVGTLLGTRLVATGSTWKYKDGAVAPAPEWSTPAFDDSSWASGPAQLGYGDGDEATLIDGGPAGAHYVSSWFRKSFVVTNASQYHALFLRLLADDGADVYLNGARVYRCNLPQGTVTPATQAGYPISGEDERRFVGTTIDRRLLVDGTNVLAVEVHQVDPSSSDVSFDLELYGQ